MKTRKILTIAIFSSLNENGGLMRRYVLISGLFLTLLTCAQLLRLLLRWPVTIAGVEIPLWVSGIAVVIVGSLAIWAFRVRAGESSSTVV